MRGAGERKEVEGRGGGGGEGEERREGEEEGGEERELSRRASWVMGIEPGVLWIIFLEFSVEQVD